MPRTDIDGRHMDRCRALAEEARQSGNTAVGALIAIGSEIIAEAGEEVPAGPDPFAHAELLVVREAMQEMGRTLPAEATLYTTHEPCLLCAFATREAGVQRVVIGERTPDIGGVTSAHPILVTSDVSRWGVPPVIVWWED